jgi:hypothetical protein
MNRQQLRMTDYLKEENRCLREELGGKRLRFTNAQRRRLAAKAKALGRSALRELGTIVTPDTLLRWHRQWVARRYDGSARWPGTKGFGGILKAADVGAMRLPARSPNLNAACVRVVRSIREECLDRIIRIGETHLRDALDEFVAHYDRGGNHQGMGNRQLIPAPQPIRVVPWTAVSVSAGCSGTTTEASKRRCGGPSPCQPTSILF